MHTSHLPKVPVLMNELPCVEPFMLSLPASRRSLRTRVRELRVRVSIVLLTLSLSYSVHVSVCTSSRGGLNGFPTWSIVSRSLPFHPLTLPRPPIHPIPTRFPLVVGCLWRRDVSSLPLYITPKNEERERESERGGRERDKGDTRRNTSTTLLSLSSPFSYSFSSSSSSSFSWFPRLAIVLYHYSSCRSI